MKIWTEISEERLAGNFAALKRILCEGQDAGEAATSLLAVVKANAYGHGIDPCAAVLARAGAEWLGVTDAHEGGRVRAVLRAAEKAMFQIGRSENSERTMSRNSGKLMSQNREMGYPNRRLRSEILVMSGTTGLAGEAESVVRERLTAVVWEAEHIARLAGAARIAGIDEPVKVHLEVDTGMSRQGAAVGAELDAVLRTVAGEARVVLDGVFTHFASTEVAGSSQTAEQQRCFETAIGQVVAAGMSPRWVHAGNSSYIDNDGVDAPALDWLRGVAARLGARSMVRSGLALYGYLLPIEGAGVSQAGPGVRPVMTWKTRVIGVRHVAAGALVGYNGTFSAERPMRLALLPVGYADGLWRKLSATNARPGGWVVVRGERAPIVGRVSMNLTTVDVSGVAGVMQGDEVVLLGDGVTADDHARLAGTIAYEILCGVRTSE